LEIANFLLRKGVKLIVVACNTASSLALSELKKRLNVPIVGVIEPSVRAILRDNHVSKIAVIGTIATVESKAYSSAIKKVYKNADIIEKACPLFVPLIEEGWIEHRITRETIKEYLLPVVSSGYKEIILGCTHYPLIKKVIKEELGNVKLIDLSIETAYMVRDVLMEKDLLSDRDEEGDIEVYLSDKPMHLHKLLSLFFGNTINHIKLVRYPDFKEERL
jgi:glutamate racemase